MAISSQNAVLNQFSPPTCIRLPNHGDLLVYDSTKKSWINRPAIETIETVKQFIELLDTPYDYTTASGKLLVVNENETGLDFVDVVDAGSYDDLTNTSTSNVSITQTNGYCGNIIPMTFLELNDTPSTYSGCAGKLVYVHEDKLEFIDIIDSGSEY